MKLRSLHMPLLCICVLGGSALSAQVADSLPPGWRKSGTQPDDYAVAIDRSVYHGGHASGSIRSRAGAVGGTGVFAQSLRADSLRGKRIRVSAWVRTRNAEAVRFFVRVDGPGVTLDFANAANDPLRGTADWKKREAVVDVPADALGLVLGLVVEGLGTLWIDDVEVVVVPQGTPRTGSAPARESASAEMERTLRERYARQSPHPRNLGFEEAIKRQ